MWLSHLRLTNSRPVMFLTVQKSKAANKITMIKVRISCPKNAFRKRNETIEAPLKTTWNRHATGFFAVANRVSTRPSSCRCLYCSEEIEGAVGVTMLRLNTSPKSTTKTMVSKILSVRSLFYLLLFSSSLDEGTQPVWVASPSLASFFSSDLPEKSMLKSKSLRSSIAEWSDALRIIKL